jgi:hypothetical protein
MRMGDGSLSLLPGQQGDVLRWSELPARVPVRWARIHELQGPNSDHGKVSTCRVKSYLHDYLEADKADIKADLTALPFSDC